MELVQPNTSSSKDGYKPNKISSFKGSAMNNAMNKAMNNAINIAMNKDMNKDMNNIVISRIDSTKVVQPRTDLKNPKKEKKIQVIKLPILPGGNVVKSRIPIRKSSQILKYIPGNATYSDKRNLLEPRTVSCNNQITQTEVSAFSPKVLKVDVETMAKIEPNNELQRLTTARIRILIYAVRIFAVLQDSIPIRVRVHYDQNTQKAMPKVMPKIEANKKLQLKIATQFWYFIKLLEIVLLRSCKNFFASLPILLLAFTIWAYSFGEPLIRMKNAMTELTKDRKEAPVSWWFY